MKQYKIKVYHIAILLVVLATGACRKMDEYKDKYASGGSIIYPGKMDSVKVFSGKNRVLITGLFTSDPKITKYRVFWNSRQDSVEVAVKRTGGVDTAKLFISNLPEGVMSFEIRTYDDQGHISVPVNIAGNVYGSLYQSSLTNRGVAKAEIQKDGSALINWVDVNSDAGLVSMRIKYTDIASKQHDTLIKSLPTGLSTSLPNFKIGSVNLFNYRTAFLPNPTAIDTFYTDFQDHSVKAEVTSIYLSNTNNFQRATFDGRWGTLAAPWITNAGAKNKDNGTNGGYTSDNGGAINWETWGNTPVVNGIVYQPTASALPAGSYTFVLDEYSEVQSNSTIYCVVAAGGNGIPVLANLSTAIASTALYNGAGVGKTSPNITDTRSVTFQITTSQVVSIGFLANIVGSGNPGSYLRLTNLRLYKN